MAAAMLAPGGREVPAPDIRAIGGAILLADCRLDPDSGLEAKLDVPQDASVHDVLAAAWTRWGSGMAEHLRGDFAIAVWQPVQRCLTLMRDIMGTRPLFYTRAKDGLVAFSSLPGALVQARLATGKPDPKAIDRMARMDLRTTADTGLLDIKRVRAGHVVRITPGGLDETRYWALTCRNPIPDSADFDATAATLRDKIATAVARRLPPGDTPVATHCTGGLDSSLVSVLAARAAPGRKVHGFANRPAYRPGDPAVIDATPYVNAVAQSEPDLNATFVEEMPVDDYAMASVFGHMPIVAMSDQVPYVAIAEQAAKRGAGMVLTGLGGDEIVSHQGGGAFMEWLLTGRWGRMWREARAKGEQDDRTTLAVLGRDVLRKLVPHSWTAKVAQWAGRRYSHHNIRFKPFLRGNPRMVDMTQTGLTTRSERLLVAGTEGALPWVAEIMALYAARHGVTCAHPFMDRDVMEFAIRLPASFLLRDGTTRAIMRKLSSGILPDMVRNGDKRRLDDATMVLRAAEGRDTFLDSIAQMRASGVETPINLDALENAVRALPDPDEHRARMDQASRDGTQTRELEMAYLHAFMLARFMTGQDKR
ncbi:MAG: asparagine synthase-related protein [Pseudomonadota bacterium]